MPPSRARDLRDLYVSEIFGPTFSGEGPLMGRHSAFLRLAGCNLHCSWCDTKYTWNFERDIPKSVYTDNVLTHPATIRGFQVVPANKYGEVFDKTQEVHRMTATQVTTRLNDIDTSVVVVTGGEPLLQQEALLPVLTWQLDVGRTVQFETNGTVSPIPTLLPLLKSIHRRNLKFVVSPKLEHADAGKFAQRVNYKEWNFLGATYKFVCQQPSDLEQVAALGLRSSDVYIMPEGTTPEQVLRTQKVLAPYVLERKWNLSTRLHTLIWSDERGR